MLRSPSPEKYVQIARWEHAVQKCISGSEILRSPVQHAHSDGGPTIKCALVRFLLDTALTTDGAPVSPDILSDTRRRHLLDEIQKDPNLCYTLAGYIDTNRWFEALKLLVPIPAEQQDTQSTVANLHRHWDDAFQGRALEALVEKLRRCEENAMSHEYYSKSFDIIQSSGMGKSRLVREMGGTILTISFALRRRGETGFPPCDLEVYDFLLGGSGNDYANAHIRAFAFLGGFISSLSNWCQQKFPESFTPGRKDRLPVRDILPTWNAAMGTVELRDADSDYRKPERRDFCGSTVQTANKLRDILTDLEWNWKEDYNYETSEEIRKILYEPLKALFDHLQPPKNDFPLLLLGFDEASNLYFNDDDIRHVALRRVLRSLQEYPLWTVFMSTNSKIDLFAMAQANDPSLRVVHGQLRRIEPFMALELNIEERRRRQADSSERTRPMAQYCTVDHMTGFGRPLWRLFADKKYGDLMSFTKAKLLGGQTTYKANNVHHVFAALASRVSLDPSLNPESIALAREAVNSHLRLLIAVDQTSGLILTSTPSEPVVAEAAADLLLRTVDRSVDPILHRAGTTNWTVSIETMVRELLSRGLVDKGTRGEIYCRIILVLARDYLLSENEFPRHGIFRFSQPFSYKNFLDFLLGKDVVTKGFSGLMERRARPRGKRADAPLGPNYSIEDGVINFTHFTHTTKHLDAVNFQNLLVDLLRSQAALQLCPSQKFWDLLIPVYFGDRDAPLNLDQVGALLIQAKNRIGQESLKLGNEYNKFFSAGALVICLQLEIGLKQPDAPAFKMRWPSFREEGCLQIPTGPFVMGVHVRGHGLETFPFLANAGLAAACEILVKEIMPSQTGLEMQICNRLQGFHHIEDDLSPADGDMDTSVGAESEIEIRDEDGVDAAAEDDGGEDIEMTQD